MADLTKEQRIKKLHRFMTLANRPELTEKATAGIKVFAYDFAAGFEVEINPYLGTCEVVFNHKCTLDQAEQDRLRAIASEVGAGHEFYADKAAGMSPDEAANWGIGTSREYRS